MLKKWIGILAIVLVVAIVGYSLSLRRSEQPKYTVLQQAGAIEIREYSPMIVAQVTRLGNREQAINSGFRALANYIFAKTRDGDKIAMTAPVMQEQNQDGTWTIMFVMPSEYTFETLPKPSNPDITLTQIPMRRLAAIRFSGSPNEKNIVKHQRTLQTYLQDNQMAALSNPIYAFYNPPWTLPFLRRNEVMILVPTNAPF